MLIILQFSFEITLVCKQFSFPYSQTFRIGNLCDSFTIFSEEIVYFQNSVIKYAPIPVIREVFFLSWLKVVIVTALFVR